MQASLAPSPHSLHAATSSLLAGAQGGHLWGAPATSACCKFSVSPPAGSHAAAQEKVAAWWERGSRGQGRQKREGGSNERPTCPGYHQPTLKPALVIQDLVLVIQFLPSDGQRQVSALQNNHSCNWLCIHQALNTKRGGGGGLMP